MPSLAKDNIHEVTKTLLSQILFFDPKSTCVTVRLIYCREFDRSSCLLRRLDPSSGYPCFRSFWPHSKDGSTYVHALHVLIIWVSMIVWWYSKLDFDKTTLNISFLERSKMHQSLILTHHGFSITTLNYHMPHYNDHLQEIPAFWRHSKAGTRWGGIEGQGGTR